MHLGVIPEGIVDIVALSSGKLPTPLLETFWGIALGRTIIAGTRLGIFETLARGKKTAQEIAEDTGCDPRAMETLLNALNGFGYLKRHRGYYTVTKKTAKWLMKNSSSSMYDVILFMSEIWKSVGDIETMVKNGETGDFHSQEKSQEFWQSYIRGLGIFARFAGPHLAKRISLEKEPQKLLDVGGGHGMYSIAFCRKYPALQAEILDLPAAVKQGKKIVSEEGLAERVRFREGDFRTSEWGGGYDIIFLFNIIHTVSKSEAPKILDKAYNSLEPGGTVAILDSEHVGNEKDLTATCGFNELLFFIINGTCVYPEEDIRRWMIEAGFSKLTKKKLIILPMMLLLYGRK